MAADTILATPYTITGSIGVISLKPHFDELYDKIGAKPQTLKRGKFADIFIGDHPMNGAERELFVGFMGNIYARFVSKAAAGRDTSYEWIDSVAQGRIWSAASAESLALIDGIGSLWDAIALAEKIAEVPDGQHARIIVRPRAENFFDMAQSFMGTSIANLLPERVREYLAAYELAQQYENIPLYLWTGKVITDR